MIRQLVITIFLTGCCLAKAEVKPDYILNGGWERYCLTERDRLLEKAHLNMVFSGRILKKMPGTHYFELDGLLLHLPFDDVIERKEARYQDGVTVKVVRANEEQFNVYKETNTAGAGYWGNDHIEMSKEIFGIDANPAQLRALGFSISPYVLSCRDASVKADAKNLAALMSKYKAALVFGSAAIPRKIELADSGYAGYLLCNDGREFAQIDFMLGSRAITISGGYSVKMKCNELLAETQ